MLTQKIINDAAYRIVGCAIEAHKQLDPGLLESIYRDCLVEEIIASTGWDVQTEVAVPISYKGKALNHNLRLDILVDDLIIVELKAVEQMIPLFEAQLLSYLKLTGKPKGLLINFNCENIVKNIIYTRSSVKRYFVKI